MKKKHLILITLASLAAISCYQEDEFPPKPTSRIEFAQESDDQSESEEESASEEYGDYDDDELEDESEDADESEDEEESTGMVMGM